MTNIIKTSDRIKELTFTTGTGTVGLTGATDGFSSFSSEYNHGDIVVSYTHLTLPTNVAV